MNSQPSVMKSTPLQSRTRRAVQRLIEKYNGNQSAAARAVDVDKSRITAYLGSSTKPPAIMHLQVAIKIAKELDTTLDSLFSESIYHNLCTLNDAISLELCSEEVWVFGTSYDMRLCCHEFTETEFACTQKGVKYKIIIGHNDYYDVNKDGGGYFYGEELLRIASENFNKDVDLATLRECISENMEIKFIHSNEMTDNFALKRIRHECCRNADIDAYKYIIENQALCSYKRYSVKGVDKYKFISCAPDDLVDAWCGHGTFISSFKANQDIMDQKVLMSRLSWFQAQWGREKIELDSNGRPARGNVEVVKNPACHTI